ncbi:MAG: RidA family protein [Synergistaceae bacterium]|jgi:2-iminobutanoate/2-iminopropanoate deaminase|nr:RidA family protein [Synergistaceae bacterium]
MKKIVSTDKAPGAIGPYSQAVQAGDFLFASGQIAIDPQTGQMTAGSVGEEAKRALENLKGVLEGAGFTMQQVVKTTVFAVSMDDFAAVNGVYAQYFGENPPARSFVAVQALPKGARVEVEAVAWKG